MTWSNDKRRKDQMLGLKKKMTREKGRDGCEIKQLSNKRVPLFRRIDQTKRQIKYIK